MLLAALLAAGVATSTAAAAPLAGQSCNLRGSWVASTAEANRYFQEINPTTTGIKVQSGALSANFAGGKFTFGSLGLKLKGRKGATTIRQEIDMQAVAPYTVHGSQLRLGPGSYKLRYISVVVNTSSGSTIPLRLPNTGVRTAARSFPYSCTQNTLRLRVLAGATGVAVTLTLQRDRG